jgi:hypothetical protein
MAQINLTMTVPDNRENEMLNAFCESHGYNPDSGLTKKQFLKQEVIEFFKLPYVEKIRNNANKTAAETVRDELNSFEIN